MLVGSPITKIEFEVKIWWRVIVGTSGVLDQVLYSCCVACVVEINIAKSGSWLSWVPTFCTNSVRVLICGSNQSCLSQSVQSIFKAGSISNGLLKLLLEFFKILCKKWRRSFSRNLRSFGHVFNSETVKKIIFNRTQVDVVLKSHFFVVLFVQTVLVCFVKLFSDDFVIRPRGA